jgi:hypothetical protein
MSFALGIDNPCLVLRIHTDSQRTTQSEHVCVFGTDFLVASDAKNKVWLILG